MMSIAPKIEASWKEVLHDEFQKPYFMELKTFLLQEIAEKKIIYPHPKNIFAAFSACPFHKVRVVLLGQDPYHGKGQAHGLCFSVQKGVAVPPSLKNIYTELSASIPGFRIPQHGCLQKWAEQGVLMLNAVLTVRAGAPASHARKGWETFTDAVIRALSEKREGIIFVLWGRYAQEKGKAIDTNKHIVLKAPHPSPFSAHSGFFGCGHFARINDILRSRGEKEIDWQV